MLLCPPPSFPSPPPRAEVHLAAEASMIVAPLPPTRSMGVAAVRASLKPSNLQPRAQELGRLCRDEEAEGDKSRGLISTLGRELGRPGRGSSPWTSIVSDLVVRAAYDLMSTGCELNLSWSSHFSAEISARSTQSASHLATDHGSEILRCTQTLMQHR